MKLTHRQTGTQGDRYTRYWDSKAYTYIAYTHPDRPFRYFWSTLSNYISWSSIVVKGSVGMHTFSAALALNGDNAHPFFSFFFFSFFIYSIYVSPDPKLQIWREWIWIYILVPHVFIHKRRNVSPLNPTNIFLSKFDICGEGYIVMLV